MLENYLVIRGNVGSDANIIVTEKDTKMTVLSIAISNNKWNPEEKVWEERDPTWIDVLCFRNIADKASLIKKGERVAVEGKLSVIYKPNEKGEKIKSLNVIATGIAREEILKNLASSQYNENLMDEILDQGL